MKPATPLSPTPGTSRGWGSWVFPLFLLLSGCNLLGTGANSGSIHLPLEVIGPDGYTESVSFNLSEADPSALYLEAHRLGYRDAPVNPGRGAKGSVRLNNGPWVDLTNATVNLEGRAKAYGGIGGGYHTLAFTVPIRGAVVGRNTLSFRFNKTDGTTSGYRILELNLLKGSRKLLPDSVFSYEDPSTWKPPLGTPQDIQKGQELWHSAVLTESPLSSNQIRATCADCHAQDGRDLKYFNYSNWSIQARAEFHGLSAREGQQIASYIRSLNVPAPRQARPWNPPYQPGPGLDRKPVAEWAAGAGLEAVLAQDKDLLPYLFPSGTSPEALAQVVDTRATLNLRELPIALQLPDWNDWLPEVHPKDLWGSYFEGSSVHQAYQQTRHTLLTQGASALVSSGQLLPLLDGLRATLNEAIGVMNGPEPCRVYNGSSAYNPVPSPLLDLLPPTPNRCEQALRSLNHWSAVKHWEVMQEFGLEDLTPSLYRYGEARGWPGQWRQVFELAPHRSANNSYNFAFQTRAVGVYENVAWYHLQLILNAGNRDPRGAFPPEWSYTLQHLDLLGLETSRLGLEAPNPLLLTATQLKLYQNLDVRVEDKGPTQQGWWIRLVHPWRLESVQSSGKGYNSWTALDGYQAGLRASIVNAFLKAFLDKTMSYPLSAWPRETDPNQLSSDKLESAGFTNINPPPRSEAELYYPESQAIRFYRAIARFKQMPGIDPALLTGLINWCRQAWPNADWSSLP